MSKETLAIDVDEVLAATTDELRLYVNEHANLNLSPEDYRVPASYWNYYEHVWGSAGLMDYDWIHKFHVEMGRDQSNIQPVAGAVEGVAQLKDAYNLVAVTSREPFMETETRRWMHEKFGDAFSEVVLLGHANAADQTKGQVCESLNASLLIDDNYDHCRSAEDHGSEAVLFGDYGWHHEHSAKDIVRCADWPAVLRFLDERS